MNDVIRITDDRLDKLRVAFAHYQYHVVFSSKHDGYTQVFGFCCGIPVDGKIVVNRIFCLELEWGEWKALDSGLANWLKATGRALLVEQLRESLAALEVRP
jgi:hypothetical protein